MGGVAPQKPSIGRVVHYYANESERPRAAIIADVLTSTQVNLSVIEHDGSSRGVLSVEFAAEPKRGRWTWPPRV